MKPTYTYKYYVRPGTLFFHAASDFSKKPQDDHCDMPHGLLQQHLHVPLGSLGGRSLRALEKGGFPIGDLEKPSNIHRKNHDLSGLTHRKTIEKPGEKKADDADGADQSSPIFVRQVLGR